ncbi:MAG: YceI family protein [Deinococcales bacterium]
MKKIFIGLGATLAIAGFSNAANETWKIVANEAFSVATVESNSDIENFTGRTSKISGEIVFDRSAKTGSVSIVVDGSSIDTGVPLRNEHMRSADWLNFDNNKDIKFVSTRVRNTSGDNYSVTGNLTMRGVTKVVTATGSLKLTAASKVTESMGIKGDVVALNTKFSIKLSDFGVKHPAIQAGRVNDKLDIILRVVATNK